MKYILSLLITFTITITAFCQGSNGLVAHWSFNGNANDISGNNLNGIIMGTVTPAVGYNGTTNSAMNLAASGGGFNIPYNSLLSFTNWSSCALVKLKVYNSNPCQNNVLFTRRIPNSGSNDYYLLDICDNSYEAAHGISTFCNSFTPTHDVIELQVSQGVGPSQATQAQFPVIDTGIWYCIVTSYSNGTLNIYLDGALIHSGYYPTTASAPSPTDLHIGYGSTVGGTGGGDAQWGGLMDDMRFYNRGLSALEANAYCDSAKMLPPKTYCDTLVFHDTLYHNTTAHDTINIHDTLYHNITVYDTIKIHDTIHHTIAVHDTITIIIRDTIHHTNTLQDTVILHDTIFYPNTIHDTIIIAVHNIVISDNGESGGDINESMWLPSAFSPNGDGKNDVFRIVNLHGKKLLTMRIFNRSGEQIFYSDDINTGWDGTYNGTPQDVGTYTYEITLQQDNSNVLQRYKGVITLIR